SEEPHQIRGRGDAGGEAGEDVTGDTRTAGLGEEPPSHLGPATRRVDDGDADLAEDLICALPLRERDDGQVERRPALTPYGLPTDPVSSTLRARILGYGGRRGDARFEPSPVQGPGIALAPRSERPSVGADRWIG